MTETRPISMHKYIDACDLLRHELKLSADDVYDRLENDVEIHYLVDFSEIFSYAFPQQTLEPLHLFGDEDHLALELLQRDALHNLFFRAGTPAVIMPPYGIELQTQLAKLRVGYFDELIRRMDEALRTIERAVATKEVRELLDELHSSEELTPAQLQNAFRIFEKHATALLLLHQHTAETPYQKISGLVNAGRVVPLPSGYLNVEPHAPTRDRWSDRLIHDRLSVLKDDEARERRTEIEERSYIDGVAMGLLYALNEATDEKVRFLFVTRSLHMHRLFDAELDKKLWRRDIFRHTRSFSSLFRRNEMAATDGTAMSREALKQIWAERHQQLRAHHESVDLFVEMTRPRLKAHEHLESDPIFLQQVKEIRDQWELSGVLATSPSEAREVHAAERRRRVMDVVKLLTEREAFTQLLDHRLSQLLDDLERGQAFAGFYAQSSSAMERRTLVNDVRAHVNDSDHAILTCRRYWVPHTIEFHSTELKDWAKDLQEKNEIAWKDIADFLRRHFSRQAEYEQQLAMAYLLASLNKWNFAERFCTRALAVDQMSHPESETLRYEGHFFLAVCFRMYKPIVGRHAEALMHLDKASALRKIRLGLKLSVGNNNSSDDDPRYLIERGNHLYKWNKLDDEHRRKPPLPISAALELWEQALRAAAGNDRMTAQIQNNICFYCCDATKSPNVRRIRDHLSQMITAQSRIDKSTRHWPPVFLDTIGVARHLLYKHSGTASDRTALLNAEADLDWTLRNAEILDAHREPFNRHLNAIRETLRASGTDQQAAPIPAAG
ncbi:MAG: hypothetical protein ACXW5U_11490 [Thermoanaerobaculia bacterium]